MFIQGDVGAEFIEIEVKLELWPICSDCSTPLHVSGQWDSYCSQCQQSVTPTQTVQSWAWRWGDEEAGVDVEWQGIAPPDTSKFDEGLMTAVEFGPLIGSVYSFIIPPARFHSWKARTKIVELASGPGIYAHRDYPLMRIRMLWDTDEEVHGTVIQEGNSPWSTMGEDGEIAEYDWFKADLVHTLG